MEMDLIPLLLQMRKTGVKLDVVKVNQKTRYLLNQIETFQKELNELAGFEVNVKSPKHKQKILDALNIPYNRHPLTDLMKANGVEEGNPILDKDALKYIEHPTIKKLLSISEYRTILSMFFESSFTEMRIGERIE